MKINFENNFMKIQWIKFLCFNVHKKVSWNSQYVRDYENF